jgi:hypothetical protein
MKTGSRIVVGASAGVCLALGVVTSIASRRQQNALLDELDRLERSMPAQSAVVDILGLADESLPAPVARYLRLALPRVRSVDRVRMQQVGSLRTEVNSDRWMRFTAEHTVAPPATGFVWNARVRIAPLLHVRVRDALIGGRGSGQVSLLSAFTVSNVSDTPEMNSGALHRFLAEAVWYPTALLPSPKLTWTKIDATRALATLTDHGNSVALEFRFADTGEVTAIFTPQRWGSFAEGYRQIPWEGHFRDYRDRGGVVVPTEGDVGWYMGDEWRAVWKGFITDYEARPGR